MSSQTKNQPNVQFVAVDNSERLKNILEVAATASWFSTLHMICLGGVGFGKSSILHYMSKQVWGPAYKRFTGAPSWTGDEVIGHENPRYLLASNPEEQGIPYWIFKETVLDPSHDHVLITEFPRTSEIATDWLVHIMDDLPIEIDGLLVKEAGLGGKTVFADGNWWTRTFRSAAIADRFSVWVWYDDTVTDASSIMRKRPIASWDFNVPTVERIHQVREWYGAWLEAADTKSKAFRALVEPINEIIRVLPQTQFSVNNRRVRQWQSILYTMGAHYADSPDFAKLPPEAFEAMTYAYPTANPAEAMMWRSVVMSIVDIEATQIAQFEAEAYRLWKNVYEDILRERDAAERQRRVTSEIAPQLSKSQKELQSRWPNNKMATDTIGRLQSLYLKMYRGEKVE